MKSLISLDPDSTRMRRRRRFSLLDAMALIAATAAGLTIDRCFWSDMHGWDGAVLKHYRDLTFAGTILSVPFAAMWTVAILALQFRRPRYRLRRLLGRHGNGGLLRRDGGLGPSCRTGYLRHAGWLGKLRVTDDYGIWFAHNGRKRCDSGLDPLDNRGGIAAPQIGITVWEGLWGFTG